MNIRMLYKQTSQYNHCRPTVVDCCPTIVDKDFVSQKALSIALYLRKYFNTYDLDFSNGKCFRLVLASDATMHVRCHVHRSCEH